MHDPVYLQHLGELATLKNFVIGTYYQTVWQDYNSDEDILEDYVFHEPPEHLQLLLAQIETLLVKAPNEVHDFITDVASSGGLYFATPEDTIEWLNKCTTYIRAAILPDQSS